jgi:hypothetical protein
MTGWLDPYRWNSGTEGCLLSWLAFFFLINIKMSLGKLLLDFRGMSIRDKGTVSANAPRHEQVWPVSGIAEASGWSRIGRWCEQ